MKEITCTLCPNGCLIWVEKDNSKWIIKGNLCPRGKSFAIDELENPKRTICSTVKTVYPEIPRLPVKTDKKIEKRYIFSVMELINRVRLDYPVHSGEIIIKNVLDTNVNIIATSDLYNLLKEEGIDV